MPTSPKPYAFVLMPFSKAFEDAYEVAIRPACEAAGAYAERVDQQIFAGSIMERVYNQISKADLVVADMSERNPNVFYEVGYAHALGKTTILVTKAEDDIPFDLRQYPHIIYGGSLSHLKVELERRVRWHIANPSAVETVQEELDVRLNGKHLTHGMQIEIRARGELGYLGLDFAVQNCAERNVRTLIFRAGVSTPVALNKATDQRNYEFEGVTLESGRVFMHPGHFTLLPHEWAPIDFRIQKKLASVAIGEVYDMTFSAYFDSGVVAIPFQVAVKGSTLSAETDA
ncbi:MAG: hypothetical protein WA632_10160 [Gallionella sp.]